MLKEIIEKKNISVYKLSKISGIPYTTLNELVLGKKKIENSSFKTIYNLSKALNLPIDFFSNNNVAFSTSWQDARNKVYKFPAIIKTNDFDISRIHPLKQKDVFNIYEKIKNIPKINKCIIFGSSTNIRCTSKSDLDIAIELNDQYQDTESKNEISLLIQNIISFHGDILWLNVLDKDSSIYKNIMKGVIIYEQVAR